MSEQLELFPSGVQAVHDQPATASAVKLIKTSSPGLPTGFAARKTPRHSDYATADGRWIIEANWWVGGNWCVFDTADPEQRSEAQQGLIRRYYEPGIPYCENPIPTDTGVIVKSLNEARAVIEAHQ